MPLSNITAIARPIDPNYPTNRAIALITLAVIVGGAIFQLIVGGQLVQSISWGIAAGLAVFLAWALARELDPDHDLSAFVAAGLALMGLLFLDWPGLTALFWMIVLLRIVNRTAGLPARILDSLLVLGLGSWLTWQGEWIYGLMTALAFFLDSQLSPSHRRHLLFAAIALIVTVALFFFSGNMSQAGQLSSSVVLAALVMAALFVPVIIASRELTTVSDQTNEPLNPRRVQAAQGIALLSAILMAWWNGYTGFASLMPLWAAMVGISLYRLFVLISGRRY
jgi:MFS family permease